MASPFPSNAVLTFSVATGAIATDPRTGNKQPATLTVTVKAYLKPDSRPRGLFYPGIDESDEPLSGRLTNPSTVPNGVGHLSKGWAVITDPVTKDTQSGWFTLYRGTPSPFGVEAALGAKVSGIFRAQAVAGGAQGIALQPTPGQYPAAIALSLHRLVALHNGQLVYADATDITQTEGAIGLTLNAVAAGGKPQFATSGLMQDTGWSWTVDQPVFVGSVGNLTQNPLIVAPGYYQEVGVAVSATQLLLGLEEAYLL
ncbi:MAG: hypothetical protein KME27_10610 [Lyngbya sp. HA4199-MV5]|jgi:hypothetical protein|nr:hypothetical protein [Lyngbya sp. HA4199-MV5]